MVVVARVTVPVAVRLPVEKELAKRENVCTPALEVILRSSPFEVEVLNVWEASVRPFNDVSPPPAPASAPQENVPVVVL
jgi:hypothetical protein